MATRDAKVQIGTNIGLYEGDVDEALKIAKCISTRETILCGYRVVFSNVIFEEVFNNNNEFFKFKNNNRGIEVILEDLETFIIHPELADPELDLLTLDRNKYTLNQILAALRVRNYGNKYKPDDNIYVVSQNVSRSQDINDPDYDRLSLVGEIKTNENYLYNIKHLEGINLKTLQLCHVYRPHIDGANDNYFAIDCGFSRYEYCGRKKYISIGELPRFKSEPLVLLSKNKINKTNYKVPVKYLDNLKDCYAVSYIDDDFCNLGVKNLVMITYGKNTRQTVNTQSKVYYMYDNKTKLPYGPYSSPKELVDIIITKRLYLKSDGKSIHTIANNVTRAIQNDLKYGTLEFEIKYDNKILEDNKVAHNKRHRFDYHIQHISNLGDIITIENYNDVVKYVAQELNIKETSAARYLRNALNPTKELDLIGNKLKITATPKKPKLW